MHSGAARSAAPVFSRLSSRLSVFALIQESMSNAAVATATTKQVSGSIAAQEACIGVRISLPVADFAARLPKAIDHTDVLAGEAIRQGSQQAIVLDYSAP